MLQSQNRLLKDSVNRISELNYYNIFDIYDDYSNGDLALGSFSGSDLLNNPRVKVENTNAFDITDAIFQASNVTTNASVYNISYTKVLSYPCLLNLTFEFNDSGEFFFGLTNSIGTHYRPEDGVRLQSGIWYSRNNNTDSSLGVPFSDYDEKVSLVLYCVSGNMTFYYKNQSSIYSQLASFATQSYVGDFYLGLAFRRIGATPMKAYRTAVYPSGFVSIGQLEALFPLI